MPKENIMFVSISIDELQTLIIDSVNACLKFHLKKVKGKDELPELLTRKQVAAYLSVSLRTVDNLARDGLLQKHYILGSTRFKREEVRKLADTWKPHQR